MLTRIEIYMEDNVITDLEEWNPTVIKTQFIIVTQLKNQF